MSITAGATQQCYYGSLALHVLSPPEIFLSSGESHWGDEKAAGSKAGRPRRGVLRQSRFKSGLCSSSTAPGLSLTKRAVLQSNGRYVDVQKLWGVKRALWEDFFKKCAPAVASYEGSRQPMLV